MKAKSWHDVMVTPKHNTKGIHHVNELLIYQDSWFSMSVFTIMKEWLKKELTQIPKLFGLWRRPCFGYWRYPTILNLLATKPSGCVLMSTTIYATGAEGKPLNASLSLNSQVPHHQTVGTDIVELPFMHDFGHCPYFGLRWHTIKEVQLRYLRKSRQCSARGVTALHW